MTIDRDALAIALFDVYDHGTQPNAYREADAVIAHLSAVPLAGEEEWEYGVFDPRYNEVDPCGSGPVPKRSDFTGINWDETGEYIVRRRIAGPWQEVTP